MTDTGKASSGLRAYRAGIALAALTSFMIVWTTIVRDDGTGAGFFLIIMAAGVGGFAASFRSAGMARTMVGISIMQMSLGLATATAPITANIPDGPFKAILFNGVFAILWLVSATLFHAAAKRNYRTAFH